MRTLAQLTARRYTMEEILTAEEFLALYEQLRPAAQEQLIESMRKCLAEYDADKIQEA